MQHDTNGARGVLRGAFAEEHARLERAMDRIASAAEGADRAAMTSEWSAFERALRAHLELEERELFPLVEARDIEAVAAARRDHVAVRALLDELGLEVELHTVRRETIDRFLEILRAHAEREDATLYRSADEALGPEAARRVVARARS